MLSSANPINRFKAFAEFKTWKSFIKNIFSIPQCARMNILGVERSTIKTSRKHFTSSTREGKKAAHVCWIAGFRVAMETTYTSASLHPWFRTSETSVEVISVTQWKQQKSEKIHSSVNRKCFEKPELFFVSN